MRELLLLAMGIGPRLPFDTGPGPKELISFGPKNGFFGEVPTSELISGADLTRHLELAGTAINPNEPWLKFLFNGRVLYISKRPIQNNVSFDGIDLQGAVYGERILTTKGYRFHCKLVGGLGSEVVEYEEGFGVPSGFKSEWDELLYYVSQNNTTYPKTGQVGPNWVNYTDSQLGINAITGQWTRDRNPNNLNSVVTRGKGSVTHLGSVASDTVSTAVNYRPMLELTFEEHFAPFFVGVNASFLDTIPIEDLVRAPTELTISHVYTPPAINLP